MIDRNVYIPGPRAVEDQTRAALMADIRQQPNNGLSLVVSVTGTDNRRENLVISNLCRACNQREPVNATAYCGSCGPYRAPRPRRPASNPPTWTVIAAIVLCAVVIGGFLSFCDGRHNRPVYAVKK